MRRERSEATHGEGAPSASGAELSKKHEAEGQGDAPWPPHYQKQDGEPPRVEPSRAKKDGGEKKATGRRVSTKPIVEIARADKKEDALLGLDRWKARHASVLGYLEPADYLIDAMRGRYRTWTRIRVNLEHVPEAERPTQEPLDADYDPWDAHRMGAGSTSRRTKKPPPEPEGPS